MVEGAMRHGTDMDLETYYVDSHGATFIGFGITRLLGRYSTSADGASRCPPPFGRIE